MQPSPNTQYFKEKCKGYLQILTKRVYKLTWHACGILLTKKIRHLGFHVHIESRWEVGFHKLTCSSMASIPEGHARLAMDGRRWEAGTNEWPKMGGWDKWTTGKRGEIPGEDGVWAARGRGREFSTSTKPTPMCVGLVGPAGNPDPVGNPPLNLDIKTPLIRPRTHSGGLGRSKSQMIIDLNLNDYPDPADVGYGNQNPAGLVGLAGHWSFGTCLGSGQPATRGRTAT
jgi:hypothetical protein